MTQDSRVSPNAMVLNSQANPCVRFSLKKRPIRTSQDMVNISSYNSDFLSGIFADVAKANVVSDLPIAQKRRPDVVSNDDSSQDQVYLPTPSKKSRISLQKSFSRARSSAMNLSELGEALSPKGINELFRSSDSQSKKRTKSLAQNHHQDSLAFQLNCVSGSSDTECPQSTSNPAVENAAKLAFPNLPATVSDSSCNSGLTRAKLVRQAASHENPTKESFGWFVDLDDNQTVEVNPSLPYAVSSDSLTFQAPKRVNDEAELEWAKAADTVDDVLGDFF